MLVPRTAKINLQSRSDVLLSRADQERQNLPRYSRRSGLKALALHDTASGAPILAIFHDGSVGLEFMTESAGETEDMRSQWLEFDCVAEAVFWMSWDA